MRNFILGVLLALSVSAIAVTQNPDGSVLLTAGEVEAVRANFDALYAEIDRRGDTLEKQGTVIRAQQKKILELEGRKCL